MWVQGLFIVTSLALLAWWFRYACTLILTSRPATNYAPIVARLNALRFPDIQQKLAEQTVAELASLDTLRRALVGDYKLLTSLMQHGATFRTAAQQTEYRMLMIDFRVMRGWYFISRRLSMTRGRNALGEMVAILQHFADAMGECNSAGGSFAN